MDEAIEVPYETVPPETLQALIEAFVLHEGTNYGDKEFSLETKVQQVLKQLEAGKAKIVFDPSTDSCGVVTKI